MEHIKEPGTLGSIAALLSKFTARTDVIFGKMLLKDSTPMLVAFVENLAACVMLFFYIGAKSFIQNVKNIEKHELFSISISAILTGGLGPIFFLQGLERTSAINTSLLVNVNPLFLSILGVILLKESFSRSLIAGMSLMMFGVIFLATHGLSQGLTFNNGDVLILLSALSYSVGTLVFKRYVHNENITILVAYRSAMATLITGIALMIISPHELANLGHLVNQIHILVAYGLIGIILTYILHYYALENTTISNNALFTLTSPIIGIGYAHLFLGERIDMVHVISMSIIIGGLLVTKLDMLKNTLMIARLKLRHAHNS
ncbi:MAG: DMT family transporter [Candidatus Gracilibacteria bacterium]